MFSEDSYDDYNEDRPAKQDDDSAYVFDQAAYFGWTLDDFLAEQGLSSNQEGLRAHSFGLVSLTVLYCVCLCSSARVRSGVGQIQSLYGPNAFNALEIADALVYYAGDIAKSTAFLLSRHKDVAKPTAQGTPPSVGHCSAL